ncbi:hypothetical protein [Desulfosediminicola flagellatus]|uniref:hypothetical protein n=1 Tax=Desulfosediminicola flagellatus TaxID=2569541 RepID=UPI0010AD6A7C|nr:hypothetical protein [Desulfosediminicola flagellatus]
MSLRTVVSAAEIEIVRIDTAPSPRFSIEIDKAEQLAGLKIVLNYPADLLIYTDGTKTDITSSFMYVINDKQPGRLILVMASAKGISGKSVELFNLEFTHIANRETRVDDLKIEQCELMSEFLKTIPCELNSSQLQIEKSQ